MPMWIGSSPKAVRAPTSPERARIYKRLQTVLADEHPFIFAYTLMQRVIVSRAMSSEPTQIWT